MENWDLNMEICDIINSTEGGPVQAVRAIKKKYESINPKLRDKYVKCFKASKLIEQVTERNPVNSDCPRNLCEKLRVFKSLLKLVVKCIKFRKNFIFLVCQKEFADELINRISPNLEPSQAIQDKVLSLIQSWAHAFSSDPDLRGVAEVYMDLKKKGVEFPVPSDDDLLLVQSNQVLAVLLNIFPNPSRSPAQAKVSPP